jgi:hypothetical protein
LTGIPDLDLWLVRHMLLLPWTQRICQQIEREDKRTPPTGVASRSSENGDALDRIMLTWYFFQPRPIEARRVYYENSRVSVLNPDGTVFLGDVAGGDLWYFPTEFPHSIHVVVDPRCIRPPTASVFEPDPSCAESVFLAVVCCSQWRQERQLRQR